MKIFQGILLICSGNRVIMFFTAITDKKVRIRSLNL